MNHTKKNILVYVNNLPPSTLVSIAEYAKKEGRVFRVMLIRDSRAKVQAVDHGADIVLDCDFSKPNKLALMLLPYQKELLAITCRSESNIARFMKVIPHVPYLRTPSTESLAWATDKYEMRKRFYLFDKKRTPKFTRVRSNTKKERTRVTQKVGFPMIIKPASLAASALVSICYHEEELEKTLRTTFRKVRTEYEKKNRLEEPCILAEEYMEGDMYSIDSYVNSRGSIFHCPPVKVTTGKNIGHDDFYNYLRVTPTPLKKESVEKAQACVERGIQALGLRSSTAHAELMRVDDDWKLVEIGPRIGGFRHLLHKLSCDIDHGLNDILIRFPRKPIIPKKCKGFAATMRYYPDKEGVITKMNGIKKIKDLDSYHEMTVKLKVGERCYYAKNGGGGIFDLTLYNADRSKLLADIRRIEQMVKVTIGNGRTQADNIKKQIKTTSKKTVKKTAKKTSKKVTTKK